MAQSSYTPILIYGSTTTGNTPLAANLTTSASGVELAVNATDGKLFYKDNAGVVQVLATKGAAQNSISFGTTGLTPSTATQGAVTVAGTLITSNGGTGLSSWTAGDLPYYATGTALSKLGIGTSGQILTSSGTAPQWSTLSGVAVTTFSAGTTGFTPSTATSGAITLAGTLATTNGGTGLTSFTANQVFYASSTSAFAQSSNLQFSGTDLTVYGITVGRGAGAVSTNTAVGASALAANSTGFNTAAFGYQALNANTGNGNSAFGSVALLTNTTGTENSAFGLGAMYSNTSGANNSALGRDSLNSNTTGGSNVAVGHSALKANTTASSSTAVGYQAGYSNTIAGSGVYIGAGAGYTNIGGGGNTFVGANAGNLFTAASGATYNAFFGAGSGSAVTSGQKNTIIGGYSGNQGGLDIRNASNKVVASDGDGNLVFHNDSAQWTTNPYGSIDITNNSSTANVLAITANTATGLFSGNNAFSGVFIINDINQTGACCICIFGGGSLQIISQSGASNYFVNSSSPGSQQIGIYSNGNVATLKPNPSSGGTTNFRIIAFRTRTAT